MKKTVHSEDDMKTFGESLGVLLRGDETIELVGDVGAGKTTFVKGLAVGLGVDEEIQSPSFTISRVYDTASQGILAHYDFYRLGEAGILSEDVQEAMLDPRTITVIEWAGIVDAMLPEDRIRLEISTISDETRDIHLTLPAYLEEKL